MEHKAKRLRRSTSTSSPLQVSSCNSSNVTESDISVSEDYEAVPLTECPYVGLKVDVLDTEKIWASAIIISSKKNDDCNGASATGKARPQELLEGEYQVTISYDGWGPEWDETLPYPNPRIVRHFTFSRRVKAFVDIQASKQKYSSSAAPEPMIFWPCQVQVRMPNINNDVAAYFLELEENVYVEPYLPNDIASSTSLPPALRRLFPICQLNYKRDNDDTRFIPGSWLPTKWLRQFRKFDFAMFSQHQLRSNFPLPGFLSAYEAAINDATTPGTLPKRLFLKGSLVNDKYRVWEQNEPGNKYTGELSDEPNRSTAAPPASSVVNDNRYSPTSSHTGKDPNLPPKLPPSIKVMETLYPTTTKCADSTNYEWFGVITSGGGNDIIVGKFSSQTEAHEAATLAISEPAADRQSETDNLKEEENNLNLAAHNMEDRIYEKISNSTKAGAEVIASIETHPLVDKDIFVSAMTDRPTVEEDQNPSAMKKDPNEILSTRNKCLRAPVSDKKTESESSCLSDIDGELKTPFGGDSLIGALSAVSKRLPGSYSVNIPITSEGLLLQVAAAPAEISAKEMANFSCTFQGYRKYSDGRPGLSELQNLIRGVGDWIVEVDGESTENMLLNQTMEMMHRKIEEKRSKNVSEMQFVFVDCSSVLPSRDDIAFSKMIDLTVDDDANRSEQDAINNLKAIDESSSKLKSSATNFELDKSNHNSQACNDDKMNYLKATIEPAEFVGAYTVYIPITTEGIPLNIGRPSEALKKELPHFSCTFQSYKKKSNGQKSVTELQNIIHGIGDWIIEVDGESMKNMSFNQVMQIIMGKIEEKRSKNLSELQITLVDCSIFNSRGTAIASPGLIDLTLDDDDESNYKKGTVAVGSNMDVEKGKVNHVIQTTYDEKFGDLQTAVEPSDIDLNRDNIYQIKSHFNADDLKASTRKELDSALTKAKDLSDSIMVKSLMREHAEEIFSSKAFSCVPQSKAHVGISTSQKSLSTNGKRAVATENDTDIVCDSTFGSNSSTEAQYDIIELSSDSETVLKTRDFKWKQGEEEAFTDESTSSANRNDILTEKVELPPGGLETTSTSNVEESSSCTFQVTQGKIQRDSAQLSIDDCQLPPILARKVKIGNGSEEDLRKISLEAVVTAVESMFIPSLHTFSMQEWTIELIRHKAYLKEVNLGGERSDYQAMKFSGDDAKTPYDYSGTVPSAAHNTGSSFHVRKQRKPRKLLV